MARVQLSGNPRARPGDEHLSARTLPGVVYYDEGVFRQELEKLFFRHWLNVGHVSQVPHPGDFFTHDIGTESLLFIRGNDDTVRGFYNVCRHRGTRIVTDERGEKLRSIVCPYHAWSYSTEGRLVGAPHTDALEEFDKEDFGLYPVRTDTWGGFIWANLDPAARPLREELAPLLKLTDHWDVGALQLGARHVYEVNANWKILAENYSECYHCAPIHPGLNRVTPYFTGENDAWMARGKGGTMANVNGGFQTFAGDYTSMTVSGYTKRPPLKGTTAEDRRRIYYWVVFPNMFFSMHPDYLMIHRDWPQTPTRSKIECEWYFDAGTMAEPDFDPSDAVDMWDEINRQDWAVCERTQLGVRSRAWERGRFSDQEPLVYDLDKAYILRMTGKSDMYSKPRPRRKGATSRKRGAGGT
ncbi:MAG TPA: aromatic ring-hydroxylating dioxygenase subunit alpha [Thermoplasmata archaeon]|nr:aromatic ring-hydroxylating dioxygenase subunit alpha [Thermoplasmata archaeon]